MKIENYDKATIVKALIDKTMRDIEVLEEYKKHLKDWKEKHSVVITKDAYGDGRFKLSVTEVKVILAIKKVDLYERLAELEAEFAAL